MMEIVDILSFSRSHEKAGVINARLNIIHTCTHTHMLSVIVIFTTQYNMSPIPSGSWVQVWEVELEVGKIAYLSIIC